MFNNRMKNIFTDYVDNDKGIFNKITNGNESEIFKEFTNGNLLIDFNNKLIYFAIDNCYHSGADLPSSIWNCLFLSYIAINGLTQTITKRYFGVKKSASNNFQMAIYNSLNGSAFLDFGDIKPYSDIVVINNTRYISFTLDYEMFIGCALSNIGRPSLEFNDELEYGFSAYITLPRYSWYNDTLDFEYLYSHSGDKLISPFVEKMLDENNTLSETNLEKIANVIKNKFVDKWNKLYSALIETEYNPIENYNMNEVETPNIERTTHLETNTNMTTSGEGDNNSKVYAFNSDSAIPSNEGHAETSQTTSGSVDDNYSDRTENEQGTRELVRSGNIGVTTTQQMLQQEIEIKKQNIYDIMYSDLDSILCLDIY